MHLRLKTFSSLSFLLFGGLIILTSILLLFSSRKIDDIHNYWLLYQLDRSEKPRLESVLRDNLGYGGMIHYYKNYLLRGQINLFDRTLAQVGAARATIEQYLSIGTNEAETIALKDIDMVLQNYMANLHLVQEMTEKGSSPDEIDQLVKIDDSPALRGLQILRSQVENRDLYSDKKDKLPLVEGRVTADLRSALGFGGMIHHYKNYILRKDDDNASSTETSIAQALAAIESYRKFPISAAENLALDDIEITVNEYSDKLAHLQTLIEEKPNISTQELDRAGSVNDREALRGLSTLDLEISRKVQHQARQVDQGLGFLSSTIPWINISLILSLLLTLLLFSWFISRQVLQPIKTISTQMKSLIDGNLNTHISGTYYKTEFGEMARGLEQMKIGMLERNTALLEIEELAVTDTLTGLGNRMQLNTRFDDILKSAKRNNKIVAVIMIDLDNFKPINDNYGHAAGDQVLVELSKRLKSLIRETDYIARLGGDEFVIIAGDIEDKQNVFLPAHRIMDQLNLPYYLNGERVTVGGSIGIALYPTNGNEKTDLLEKADLALYTAKENSGSSLCFFENDKAQLQIVKQEKVFFKQA